LSSDQALEQLQQFSEEENEQALLDRDSGDEEPTQEGAK